MTAPARVEIERLSATYLQSRALDGDRADRLLRRLAGTELERAVAELAVPDGLWCLRRVPVSVRLDPQASDLSLARAWADAATAAVAAAVRQAATSGHAADAAWYRSRREACLELVTQVAAGRWDRAWAWQQLGLLDGAHPSPAGPLVLRVLAAQDSPVLGLLVSAVERCGVAPLHRALGAEGWESLARLLSPALAGERAPDGDSAGAVEAGGGGSGSGCADAGGADASGADAGAADAGGADAGRSDPGARDDGGGAAPRPHADPPSGRPGPAAPAPPPRGAFAAGEEAGGPLVRTVLAASRFAAAARRSGLRVDARTAAAWAVISLVEVDPRAERQRERGSALAGLVRVFTGGAPGRAVPVAPLRRPPTPPPLAAGARPATARPGPRAGQPSRPGGAPHPEHEDRAGGAGRMAHPGSPPRPADRTTDRPADRRAGRTTPAPAAARNTAGAAGAGVEERDGGAADTERGIATAWGGLPFLLNTAAAAGLPGAADEGPLGRRGIRWTVHALAQRLTPAPADDPAALALAGLTPDDVPPTSAEPAATADEVAALDVLAGVWARATVARLLDARQEQAPVAAADVLDVLHDLVSRPALVVAEPGWIEVHLALHGVRLDVRRAGLDLDPGWVPWLGAVVRLVYRHDIGWGAGA